MILLFKVGFLEIEWKDIIDIFFVTILIAQVYNLMRGSVAIKVFLGFLFLYLSYLIVNAAQMELLGSILGEFMGLGVLTVIVLFQQEIRKFLLVIGKTPLFSDNNLLKALRFSGRKVEANNMNVGAILESVKTMSKTKTGALLVISKDSELKFYAESGDSIDAIISKRLIISIFNKNSPLHDGAVIIFNGRLVAARCILPVSERSDLPAQYGLRHRAALGMSENSDSLIIIVSEETGQVSVTQNGMMTNNIGNLELRKKVNDYLSSKEGFQFKKFRFSRKEDSEPTNVPQLKD